MLADGIPVVIELEEKDPFKLTPEKLLEKITGKAKILVLPSPTTHRRHYGKEELEEIAKLSLRRTLFVISDEEIRFRAHTASATAPSLRFPA